MSVFTYENRGPGEARLVPDRRGCAGAGWTIERWPRSSTPAEDEAGLPLTRPPEAGFVGPGARLGRGRGPRQVIADEEMSGGDFVRNIKQLIDLLRQLGDVPPSRRPPGRPGRPPTGCFAGWSPPPRSSASDPPGGRRGDAAGAETGARPIPHVRPAAPLGWATAMGYLDTGIYAVEQWTEEEGEILRRYFTNLDGPVFALVNG